MSNTVTLMVRASRKARWRRHGVYATRDEAWVAITALPDKRAHVRLVETGDPPEANEQLSSTAPARSGTR